MYLDIDGYTVMHTFDNVSEFIELALNGECEVPFSERASRSKERYGGFFGSDNIEEATELAYHGYPKAREFGEPLREMAIELISPHIIKPKPQYDRVGEIIDVSRYLSGMPDDFIVKVEPNAGFTERGKSNKIFRIGVNLTYVCNAQVEEIIRRGAAIVALIELLEQQGRRVEVLGIIGVHERYNKHSTHCLHNFITIKESGQAVDIDFLYFILAHPSMLRRFGFSVWETYPKLIREKYGIAKGGNYGTVSSPTIMLDCDIYFSHVLDREPFRTVQSSMLWVSTQLATQGAIDASVVELVKSQQKPETKRYPF